LPQTAPPEQNAEHPGVLDARLHGTHLWWAVQSSEPSRPRLLLLTHWLTQVPQRLRMVAWQNWSGRVL
jgi:hypothetical protein